MLNCWALGSAVPPKLLNSRNTWFLSFEAQVVTQYLHPEKEESIHVSQPIQGWSDAWLPTAGPALQELCTSCVHSFEACVNQTKQHQCCHVKMIMASP